MISQQQAMERVAHLGAAAAARAVLAEGAPAGAVFPEGLPEGGTDFNDLALHAGPESVRQPIEQAIASPSVPKPRQAAKSGAGAHESRSALLQQRKLRVRLFAAW